MLNLQREQAHVARGGPSAAEAERGEAGVGGASAEHGEAEASGAALDPVDRVRACGRDDLFGVLGLERGAHADEVRPAYHTTSKAVHPDKNPEREEEATEAMQMAVAKRTTC